MFDVTLYFWINEQIKLLLQLRYQASLAQLLERASDVTPQDNFI